MDTEQHVLGVWRQALIDAAGTQLGLLRELTSVPQGTLHLLRAAYLLLGAELQTLGTWHKCLGLTTKEMLMDLAK